MFSFSSRQKQNFEVVDQKMCTTIDLVADYKYANSTLYVVKSASKILWQQMSAYNFLSFNRGKWILLGIMDFFLI